MEGERTRNGNRGKNNVGTAAGAKRTQNEMKSDKEANGQEGHFEEDCYRGRTAKAK